MCDTVVYHKNHYVSTGTPPAYTVSMTTTQTTETTLGTWKNRKDGRHLTASYLDAEHVRVDRSDRTSDVYTEREWLTLYDMIRDGGFTRA